MTESAAEHPLPPSVARVLSTFRALGREEKMQSLLHFAKKLEPGTGATPISRVIQCENSTSLAYPKGEMSTITKYAPSGRV